MPKPKKLRTVVDVLEAVTKVVMRRKFEVLLTLHNGQFAIDFQTGMKSELRLIHQEDGAWMWQTRYNQKDLMQEVEFEEELKSMLIECMSGRTFLSVNHSWIFD